jgi:hypothetical protein
VKIGSQTGFLRWAVRRAAAACINAVGPAGNQVRGRMEMRSQNGTWRDSAGLSGTGFPGLGALTWAIRNSRTRGGQNVGFTRREWRNGRSVAIPMGGDGRSVKPSAQPTLVRTQHLPPPAEIARELGFPGLAGCCF